MLKRILSLLLLTSPFLAQSQESVNVMSFNIRYATTNDGVNQWNNRKDRAAETVNFYDTDLCGMQEALYSQILDLEKRLLAYGWVGIGRDDGDKAGEFSPIFYLKERFKLIETNTFWLNEHPESVGLGWDARINRVVTWAKFEDKATSRQFIMFNTHFDHQGVVARRESAKLLLKKVEEISGDLPFVVTGDFNAKPTQEPIQILTDSSRDFYFTDTKQVSKMPHFGPEGTFTGFESKERENEPIDHIFIPKRVEVLKHATLSGTWNGLFASDHHPVLAVLKFN